MTQSKHKIEFVQIGSVAVGKKVKTSNLDIYEITGTESGARTVRRVKNVSNRPARRAIGNPVLVEVVD